MRTRAGHTEPSKPARETMTIAEAARMLGVGRTTAYQAAKSGQLPTIRIGKRIVVSRRVVERLLGG